MIGETRSAVDPGEPEAMVVSLSTGERIAYLRWPAPAKRGDARPSDAHAGTSLRRPILLLHGLARTSWSWLPVARRLVGDHVLAAPDLRGHGASEAPREGYDLESLALDALTVVSAQGWGAATGLPVVIGGHGLGALVAVEMARLEPDTVAGLVLVDGGWEEIGETTRLSPPELLAAMADPPEVMASMGTYLEDRRAFDPATWDGDQERAARAAVVERHAGHVSPVVRASVMRRLVEALFAYQPLEALGTVPVPVTILVAGAGTADDEERRERLLALDDLQRARATARVPAARVRLLDGAGHDLMRHRPDDVAAALRSLASDAGGAE